MLLRLMHHACDPLNLNLKNVFTEELGSLSGACISTSKKNASSRNHCEETRETDQVQCMLPFDKNKAISKQECQSVGTSVDVTEKLCFVLNDKDEHCVQVSPCSTNHCKTDTAARIVTNNTTNEHMSSIFNRDKAVTCTYNNKVPSHEKVVLPVELQCSHRQVRKRKQQSASACKETYSSVSSSRKSFKKSKEKFPCGNYVAYYGYRNVNRVEDLRLQLLSQELFEGKDVLDIGCNAGIVTIAVACTYLPKQILGIDVDQRLISLAKRNVRRYLDEHSYPPCLETTFGHTAATLLPSAECATFPHNILFQVVSLCDILKLRGY